MLSLGTAEPAPFLIEHLGEGAHGCGAPDYPKDSGDVLGGRSLAERSDEMRNRWLPDPRQLHNRARLRLGVLARQHPQQEGHLFPHSFIVTVLPPLLELVRHLLLHFSPSSLFG